MLALKSKMETEINQKQRMEGQEKGKENNII